MIRRRRIVVGLATTGLVLGLADRLTAQAASSTSHFLVGAEVGAGGRSGSTNHRLDASFGCGVVPLAANAANTILAGGFAACLDAAVAGRPWLTGAKPLYVPYQGGVSLGLHGTELALGASTTAVIGATPVAVPVTARTRDRVQVTIPTRTLEPGWQPVAVWNAGGVSVLPRGVGVLPLLEKNRAIQIGEPFRVTYRGYPGDLVYIAIAGAKGRPIRIPPYHGALRFNPGTLIEFFGPLVAGPTGELHINGPSGRWARPVVVQMLGVHRTPTLGSGAVTNVLEL